MSVAIYTKNDKQSLAWSVVLNEELPTHTIEVYPSISDFEKVKVLVCWKPAPGLVGQFPNLRAIQSLGAGVDHIFATNVIDANIQISKIVDDQLTQDMWEFVLSQVLAEMKNFSFFKAKQREGVWKARRYKSIKDVSIGILGLGAIGQFVADNFSKLGFTVKGWSNSEKDLEGVQTFVGKKGLQQMCENVDYLVNILPLTNATKGVLSLELFTWMKEDGYLINVGRGEHLREEDLLKALDEGLIRGASLDVFTEEPLPSSHAFWRHSKVQVTPHIASLTNITTVYPQVVENIKRIDAGLPILNGIDRIKGY